MSLTKSSTVTKSNVNPDVEVSSETSEALKQPEGNTQENEGLRLIVRAKSQKRKMINM